MSVYLTPRVYREELIPPVAVGLATGVPGFLGYASQGPIAVPTTLTIWAQFEKQFGPPLGDGYLASAVRGFFDNEGELCYVVRLDPAAQPSAALSNGLDALAPLDTVDLICTPDVMRPGQPGDVAPDTMMVQQLQGVVLTHCRETGDRFAILDSRRGLGVEQVLEQRRTLGENSNGGLYYPWIKMGVGDFAPPCGHVAGVFARTDRETGVHKAPANAVLEGVLDLEVNVSDGEQGSLNPEGVNCLRAFPGRGLRVWGARTLSKDPAWIYVNVRRLFLTAGRWIERNLIDQVLEPNDAALWARIERELTAYFDGLFRAGALKGATAQEAFYVKCDAVTNPPDVRERGQVVTEIGLAPASPSEFVVVRIVHSATGISIVESAEP